jgi:hypothetical protein
MFKLVVHKKMFAKTEFVLQAMLVIPDFCCILNKNGVVPENKISFSKEPFITAKARVFALSIFLLVSLSLSIYMRAEILTETNIKIMVFWL